MKVTQFSLPKNFEPKPKICHRKKISRCLWISPDTLFTLCEIMLRKLLLSVVPRRKFWSTVVSLLPNESARRTVRHQIEQPWEFNRFERTTVNYANHWELLTAAIQHRLPMVSNIRVGSLVRNKITQLLLDLECYSGYHHGSDCQQLPFQHEPIDDLNNEFMVRPDMSITGTPALNPEEATSHCSCEQPNCYAPSFSSKGHAIQQLMVTGQATSQQVIRGSCRVQMNDSIPCDCCQAKM
ncbi:uncharacterized protein LOC131440293 [Malaya genurostris]|uniref:uncharacterized protein LOC131440293 n=1 Tax=Malaya genurostris TaxID=325434 RepID=UPI0026F3AF34|nr:uncharacterized protein LOC131440293 [Malaya genurostris]